MINEDLLEELLGQIIEIENVEVELFDRADGDTDDMLANNLREARLKMEEIYNNLKEAVWKHLK